MPNKIKSKKKMNKLIHGTKPRKDNQLGRMEYPYIFS